MCIPAYYLFQRFKSVSFYAVYRSDDNTNNQQTATVLRIYKDIIYCIVCKVPTRHRKLEILNTNEKNIIFNIIIYLRRPNVQYLGTVCIKLKAFSNHCTLAL